MKPPVTVLLFAAATMAVTPLTARVASAQAPTRPAPAEANDPGRPPREGGGRFDGFGGPGGFGGGPGGFGGPGGDREIVKQFDKDNDGRLDGTERAAAREFVKKNPSRGGPGGGPRMLLGPGEMLAPLFFSQGDKDSDQKLNHEEFAAIANAWFDELDADKTGKVDADRFAEGMAELLPPPSQGAPGGGPRGGGGGRGPGGGFGGPGRFVGPALFDATDADKDGSLKRDELVAKFASWFDGWDADKDAALTEKEVSDGLNAALPRPNFGGPGGGGRGPGGGGFGGPMGAGRQQPGKPGPKVSVGDVTPVSSNVSLYDAATLRTLFLDFDAADWEAELNDFRDTDVEVPATLTVDGKKLPLVGVKFRGMSSLGMVPAGSKRSLNLSLDFADKKQRLYGYKTLNLLNSHEDPTFLHTVLFFDVARHYIPAPKANFAKVVINGESWGVYVNAQQFNKEFIKEWFPGKADGARWKVRGSPGGRGGLDYLGEDAAPYKSIYGIKSDDKPESWAALIKLCRTISETPVDKLEAALEPILDVDGALWFLALENAFINGDGYWVRASDYCLYLDGNGRFHVIPHDANETFGPPMGPGMGGGGRMRGPGGGGFGTGGFGGGRRFRPGEPAAEGGPDGSGRPDQIAGEGSPRDPRPGPGGGFGFAPRGGGLELDPLVGLDDRAKPLRSRLLAVPALRARYLAHVKELAERWMSWDEMGPIVARYRGLIESEVAADTRKLESTEAFAASLSPEPAAPSENKADGPEAGGPRAGGGGPRSMSLRQFLDARRAYLLKNPDVVRPAADASSAAERSRGSANAN